MPLFAPEANSTFEGRIRSFAREVAKRHRAGTADRAALVLALRGYYRTWAIFERLPPLDRPTLALALAEYDSVRTGRRAEAA